MSNLGHVVVDIRPSIQGKSVDSGHHWAPLSLHMHLGNLGVTEGYVVDSQVQRYFLAVVETGKLG